MDIKVLYNGFAMLSRESKIDSIVEIIYDQLKGKHKDRLAKQLAEEILDAIEDEAPTWYEHG
jgi:ribosomal protein S7